VSTLSGCSAIESVFGGDKVDYKTTAAKSQPLEVPPDLTQLARDSRYQPQGGVVSASGAAAIAANTATPAAAVASGNVALANLGAMKIERDGQQRWLLVQQTPEQLWPALKAFWEQRGFTLAQENAPTGVMETEWAENRAKLPNDPIRNTIGKFFSGIYDSGLRDRYRTRLERTAKGTEITISHRGLEEVYTSERKESTVWRTRASEPQLEAEMLSQLMLALGSKDEPAKTAVAVAAGTAASAPTAPPDQAARLRAAEGNQLTSLVIDEPFERAWRRVGLALDRGGFTVEDRDRAGGLYYVRYIDPKNVGKDEPSWWSKLFGDGTNPQAALRYRIALKGAGEKTNLSVQTATGAPDAGENAKRIIGLLVNDLK
jgi:outer membrane protein assembly factor BamC